MRQARALAREMVRYAESHVVDARELRPDECEPYRRTLGPYMVGVMIARVENGRLARYVTVSRDGARPDGGLPEERGHHPIAAGDRGDLRATAC